MIRFESDYLEGAHPRILERLAETNFEQTAAYGTDAHCERARALISAACGGGDLSVHFLVGGTQTNLTVIASVLRPHQGVLAADTGHISAHETGAVEATGHKVLTLPSPDGKLTAGQIDAACRAHREDPNFEHIVQPGMVYISNPTENGTIYSKAELSAISAVCRENGLPLYLDGARLGYGLVSPGNDLTLPDVAALCDAFYIGGTKVGALFGEALVIRGPAMSRDFRYHMKQRGGLLAKGRLLGIQFETLFEDGLYWDVSRHAVGLALQVRDAFRQKGVRFLYDSPTNQQFPILTRPQLAALSEKYTYSEWGKAVRFCTSWATSPESVKALIADIKALA